MASLMSSSRSSRFQGGFTYLAMLLAVAVIGFGLAATGEVWVQSSQREKEKELLFVGNQYRKAITLYYERTPGAVKRYPEKLEDLLLDNRQVSVQRYLRKIYVDPLTGKAEWGLITIKQAGGEGIMGVYSKSGLTPIKTSGFLARDKTLEGANHFSDWKFFHEPSKPMSGAAGKPAASGTQASAPLTATPLQSQMLPTGTLAPK
jgi:type II secretory pathway pseudopilin PulG